jgi:hypothetical protein
MFILLFYIDPSQIDTFLVIFATPSPVFILLCTFLIGCLVDTLHPTKMATKFLAAVLISLVSIVGSQPTVFVTIQPCLVGEFYWHISNVVELSIFDSQRDTRWTNASFNICIYIFLRFMSHWTSNGKYSECLHCMCHYG